jgi:hypothetical protein
VAEYELMNASHRFLEQFTTNPFAGTDIKGHESRRNTSTGSSEKLSNKAISVVEDKAAGAAAATVSVDGDDDIDERCDMAGNARSDDEIDVGAATETEADDAESSVRIITNKAPFQFSKSHLHDSIYLTNNLEASPSNWSGQILEQKCSSQTQILLSPRTASCLRSEAWRLA